LCPQSGRAQRYGANIIAFNQRKQSAETRTLAENTLRAVSVAPVAQANELLVRLPGQLVGE
jgi:hypothetical protein